MRRLTLHERTALVEVGPPDEGPIPDDVFRELERLGWGLWVDGFWTVTDAGKRALELELLSDAAETRR